MLARRLASDPSPVTEPIKESLPAAVLLADISGFSALSNHLIEQGPTEIEALASLLDTYFGHLIYLIATHNGDVIKFGGDSLLALWPARAGIMIEHEEDLGTATGRATQCALTLQQHFSNYETPAGILVSLRLAVGTGEVSTFHLGGVYKRWEFLISGKALTQAKLALNYAQAGDTVLSHEAWALVQDNFVGHPLTEGNIRLEAIRSRMPLRAAIAPDLPSETEAALQGYIPGAVLANLSAEQSNWLNELRPVTVLFINIPELNDAAPLIRIQTAVRTLQGAIYQHEGSISKVTMSEDGVTLVASLGLPPLVHEDDAIRGVQAALMIQAEFHQLGLASRIGVSTGQAFCGPLGNSTRREYTMMGQVVDRASLLMQTASQHEPNDAEPVLCDDVTYQVAKTHFSFETLPLVTPQDNAQASACYRPYGQAKKFIRRQTEMVGRRQEKAVLAEGLQALIRNNSKTVVVIEGEAGIGKSRLVEDLLRQAEILNVNCLLSASDAIEKSTPYYVWRAIFEQLFDIETAAPRVKCEHVLQQLRTQPELLPLAPLLNVVLPLDLPDNDLTAQMIGEVRANNTHALLLRLLQAHTSQSPTVLILEDAAWFDNASWVLLELVNREVHPLVLVITRQPVQDSFAPEYSNLIGSPDTKFLHLGPLSPDQNLELVCRRLGVASLPKPVVRLLYEKTAGHPFFSEELAYSLRDEGVLEITNGQCHLASGEDYVSQLDAADSVQEVIAKRIDYLTAQQQRVLRAASVIGRVFSLRILHSIYPVEADKPHLATHLEALEKLGFTRLQSANPDPAYIFKHVIIQHAIYNLIVPGQKRQLHRAVAAWVESAHSDDLPAYYPLLAYHLSRADDGPKAIAYLEKAGQQALHNHANHEAIDFFSNILALERTETTGPAGSQRPYTAGQVRRASWERQLGEAHIRLGNLTESYQHLRRALGLLGRPVPATPVKLAAGSLRELLRQVRHRFWPGRFVKGDLLKKGKLLEAVQAAWHLTRISYMSNEMNLYLYTSLLNLNLAEALGSSPELARSYANMCLMIGLIPFHFVAKRYYRLAQKAVADLHEDATLTRVLDIISIYELSIGRWNQVQASLGKAVEIYDGLGDRRRWEGALSNLATAAFYQGQFAYSAKLRADIYASARQHHDDEIQAWILNGQAECKLRLGHPGYAAEAVNLLEMALSMMAEGTSHQPELIRAYGLLAVARLRLGQQHSAREAADKAARLIAHMRPATIHLLDGYAGVAEVYLTLWKASSEQLISEWSDLAQIAQQACKALHRYAYVFSIGQPRAWLWQGIFDWLDDKPSRAHKVWQKSLATAERLAMPYEQGLAHFVIGQHLPQVDSSRQEHLSQACEIFIRLDAAHELIDAQKLLATTE